MIIDINKHAPSSAEKFFFDANIWLYMHCPLGNYKAHITSSYSNFYKKITNAKSEIYISSQVVSEFVNAYLRLDFAFQKRLDSSLVEFKKDYRNSRHYGPAVSLITSTLNNKILPKCHKLDDRFTSVSMADILKNLQSIDYNDSYLHEQIKGQNIKIITNDFDFQLFKKSCDIVTSNPKLLALPA